MSPRRSPVVRVLAPLALLLTAVVLIAVISSSLGGGGESQSSDSARSGNGEQTTETTSAKVDKPPKEYVVQPGDSVSTIAEQFGLTVDEILALNSGIDPQALVTGEALKLR